jgi:hypothetical protein
MSKVKLGNGASLESYLKGAVFGGIKNCDCIGTDVGSILSAMSMAGSNLYHLYNGPRCVHGQPLKAANVAYIVDNFYEQAIKVKGQINIQSWLNQMMKGSVALVFFRSNGQFGGTALDLYLGDHLYINSGVSTLADEMWVWCMGSPLKSLKQHKHKTHHKPVRIF